MIKLIACDLDGTLLNNKKEIDREIYSLLPKLFEKNIRFVAASGRQYPSIAKLFADFLEDVVIVAENGAYVVHNDHEISASVMEQELVGYCIEKISSLPGVTPLVSARRLCYTDNQRVQQEMSAPKFQYDIQYAHDLYHLPDEIIKVSLIDADEKGAAEHSFKKLSPMIAQRGEIAVSGFACVDIVNKGVSKGEAIQKLQQQWGILPEETMAFGDSYNDIEMLGRAAYSFAMKNAEDGVKKHARYLAGTNDEGGVVKEIRRLTGL